MQKSSIPSVLVNIAAVLVVIVVGSYVIIAQAPIIGEWTANINNEWSDKSDKDLAKDAFDRTDKVAKVSDPNKIHIQFERKTAHGSNSNGQSYAYSDLQGLTRESAQNGRVHFSLVRDAGTVECDGNFVNGKGSGTFTFTPNASYVSSMRSRGFDFTAANNSRGGESNEDKLLSAALLNVTTALADDLNSANFGKLEVDDLFKAAIFKVDGKFMAEMKATGFPNLQMEDLVKARIFKIDADYVRQVHEMGFDNRDFEGMVKFSIFKVTPEFLGELKSAGLSTMDSEDIVKCRIFKIDADFVRKARATDPNATIEDMVQMKIGVYRKKGTDFDH